MSCSICLNDITSDNVTMRCGHVYHKECIKCWYLRGDCGRLCPVCRQSMQGKLTRTWENIRDETRKQDCWEKRIKEMFEYYEMSFEELEGKYLDSIFRECLQNELMEDLIDMEWKYANFATEEFEEIMEDPMLMEKFMEDMFVYFDDVNNEKNLFVGDKESHIKLQHMNPCNIIRCV